MSKERLVELIGNAPFGINKQTLLDRHKESVVEELADYILTDGWIRPPCKVGQTVFRTVKLYGDEKTIIVEGEAFEIALTHENGEIKKRFYFLEKGANKIINRYSLWLDFDNFGKTVFLTREEAEAKLKEGNNEV